MTGKRTSTGDLERREPFVFETEGEVLFQIDGMCLWPVPNLSFCEPADTGVSSTDCPLAAARATAGRPIHLRLADDIGAIL